MLYTLTNHFNVTFRLVINESSVAMHEVQDDNQMTWNFTLVNLMSSFEVERLRENEKKKETSVLQSYTYKIYTI